MGKGLIIENLGDGLYSIKIEKNQDDLLAMIVVLNNEMALLEAEIASTQAEIEGELGGTPDPLPDPIPDPDEPDEPEPDPLPPGDSEESGSVS